MSSAATFTAFAAAVQRAARSGTWSVGVKLARASAVAVESREAREIVLRVQAPGRAVAPTVVLYPEDNEWECDCPSRVNPCEHVVAAVIALGLTREAVEGGTAGGEVPGAVAEPCPGSIIISTEMAIRMKPRKAS